MKHDITDISRMLTDRAEAVVTTLLPGGKRMNGHWVCGDLSGSPGESLKVNIHGEHAGRWRDWASDEHGDLLDLWGAARGVPVQEALKQARAFLGISEPVKQAQTKVWASPVQRDIATQNGKVRKYLRDERKLDDAIVNRFRVAVRVDEREDQKVGYIAFPSYSPTGELLNHCYVSLTRNEKGKKDVKQDKGCPPSLFGWQGLDRSAYDSKSVMICEGQIDCMTWTQWGFNCLSIPNGGGNTWIDYEWDNLEQFKVIYLSYDMDGKLSSNQEAAISRLGKHRCRLVKIPHKDANDGLKAGMTAEEAEECVKNAETPTLKNFVTAKGMRDRVFSHFFPTETGKKLQPPILTSHIPGKVFTVRPGEVSVWTGISGHGKTTYLAQFFVEMVMAESVTFIASMEMRPEKIITKMAKCVAHGAEITREDLDGFLDIVGDRITFYDDTGELPVDRLFELMKFAYCRYGATQFLIDSFMKVEGMEEDYKAQTKFLNDLCKFASDHMVHIHLVAHPRKTENDGKPSANDLKGSSVIRNQADNVFVVHRNFSKEKKFESGEIDDDQYNREWDTSVMVEKDREEGDLKMFYYKYVKSQERYTLMKSKGEAPVTEKPKKRRWNDD